MLFELTGRAVHVWSVHTAASDAVVARFDLFLAPDERERAARFRFDHLRHSFIIARGALRILLGNYLDISPATVQFDYGAKGKPSLKGPAHLDFNISHSGDLAAFAFTAGCEIGVDVEQIRPLPDMWNVVERFFASEEASELMSLPANERERAFFLCWTRKEAYIKAIGDGLSAPLDGFRVTLHPGETARLIHLSNNTDAARAWTLFDLHLAPNYAASLAYHDTERPVAVVPPIHPTELLSIA